MYKYYGPLNRMWFYYCSLNKAQQELFTVTGMDHGWMVVEIRHIPFVPDHSVSTVQEDGKTCSAGFPVHRKHSTKR